mmetsp:Transcript_60423/g.118933  ORF Transcript_60423/g.118933 Transcript_60423/m.118933 type:complete len:383 (+) Transcript_60423:71-1219(+)
MRFFKSSATGGKKRPETSKDATQNVFVPSDKLAWGVTPITRADLDETLVQIGKKIITWDSTRIVLVKQLQEAARNHGRVELMKDTTTNTPMAVKRMPTRWVRTSPQDFEKEYPSASEQPWYDIAYVKRLATVGFPYVCEFYGMFRSDSETFVASQFCSEGDLFGWCDNSKVPAPGPGREEFMKPIVAQIFAAVRWMHDLGIAHRDLSLENILLEGGFGADAKVKLIDFGMATTTRMVANEIRGKNSYQAPEVHFPNEPVDTYLLDTFAVGVTIFAMSVHDYPWTCTRKGKCQLFQYVSNFGFRRFLQKRKLRRGRGETLNEVLTPAFVDTVAALVDFAPEKRGSLGEICYSQDVAQYRRLSVWDMPYMKEFADKVPQVCQGN